MAADEMSSGGRDGGVYDGGGPGSGGVGGEAW